MNSQTIKIGGVKCDLWSEKIKTQIGVGKIKTRTYYRVTQRMECGSVQAPANINENDCTLRADAIANFAERLALRQPHAQF